MLCRYCDPEVGVGMRTSICPTLCDDWYRSCMHDFFSFRHSGELAPCSSNSQEFTICSKMSELASDGDSLCRQLDMQTRTRGEACFNGRPPKAPFASCSKAAPKVKRRLSQVIDHGPCTILHPPGSATRVNALYIYAQCSTIQGADRLQKQYKAWINLAARVIGGAAVLYLVRRWFTVRSGRLMPQLQEGAFPGRPRRLRARGY